MKIGTIKQCLKAGKPGAHPSAVFAPTSLQAHGRRRPHRPARRLLRRTSALARREGLQPCSRSNDCQRAPQAPGFGKARLLRAQAPQTVRQSTYVSRKIQQFHSVYWQVSAVIHSARDTQPWACPGAFLIS